MLFHLLSSVCVLLSLLALSNSSPAFRAFDISFHPTLGAFHGTGRTHATTTVDPVFASRSLRVGDVLPVSIQMLNSDAEGDASNSDGVLLHVMLHMAGRDSTRSCCNLTSTTVAFKDGIANFNVSVSACYCRAVTSAERPQNFLFYRMEEAPVQRMAALRFYVNETYRIMAAAKSIVSPPFTLVESANGTATQFGFIEGQSHLSELDDLGMTTMRDRAVIGIGMPDVAVRMVGAAGNSVRAQTSSFYQSILGNSSTVQVQLTWEVDSERTSPGTCGVVSLANSSAAVGSSGVSTFCGMTFVASTASAARMVRYVSLRLRIKFFTNDTLVAELIRSRNNSIVLRTNRVILYPSDDNSTLGLVYGPAHPSFVYQGSVDVVGEAAGALPPIVVRIVSFKTLQPVEVQEDANLVLRAISSDPSSPISGNVMAAVNSSGIATFTGMSVVACGSAAVDIWFSAVNGIWQIDTGANSTQWQRMVQSVGARFTLIGARASAMRFRSHDSFVSEVSEWPLPTQPWAPLPSFVIELVDSCGNLDYSSSVVRITASSTVYGLDGVLSALALNGSAYFNRLMPTSSVSFLAGTQGDFPVKGFVLGPCSFNVIDARVARIELAQQDGVWGRYTTASTPILIVANHLQPLPVIRLLLKDSGGIVSSFSDTSFNVTAQVSSRKLNSFRAGAPKAVLLGGTVLATNATVAFDQLTFVACSPSPMQLSFVLSSAVASSGFAGQGFRIVSFVDYLVRGLPASGLAFSAVGSAASHDGDVVSAPLSKPLPTMRLQLLDSCGDNDRSSNGVVVYANSSCVLQGAVVVATVDGVASFENLMVSAPCTSYLVFRALLRGIWRSVRVRLSVVDVPPQIPTGIDIANGCASSDTSSCFIARHLEVIVPFIQIGVTDKQGNLLGTLPSTVRVCAESTSPDVVVGGITCEDISNSTGKAIFRNLTVVKCSKSSPYDNWNIHFFVTQSGILTELFGRTADVVMPPVEAALSDEHDSLKFAATASKEVLAPFTGQASILAVNSGNPMPYPLAFQRLDSCERRRTKFVFQDAQFPYVRISVPAYDGTVAAANTTVLVQPNGTAVFHRLTFTLRHGAASVTVRFVNGAQQIAAYCFVFSVRHAGHFMSVAADYSTNGLLSRTAAASAVLLEEVPLAVSLVLVGTAGTAYRDKRCIVDVLSADDEAPIEGGLRTADVTVSSAGKVSIGAVVFLSCAATYQRLRFTVEGSGVSVVSDPILITVPPYKAHHRVDAPFLVDGGRSPLSLLTAEPFGEATSTIVGYCGAVVPFTNGAFVLSATPSSALCSTVTAPAYLDGVAQASFLSFCGSEGISKVSVSPQLQSGFPGLNWISTPVVDFSLHLIAARVGASNVRFADECSFVLHGRSHAHHVTCMQTIPAIVVDILDTALMLDTTAVVEVEASCAQSRLQGTTSVLSASGKARFADLSFADCRQKSCSDAINPVRLTFTAKAQDTLVSGKSILSPPFDVHSPYGLHVGYSPYSDTLTSDSGELVITVGVPLPPFCLAVLDACDRVVDGNVVMSIFALENAATLASVVTTPWGRSAVSLVVTLATVLRPTIRFRIEATLDGVRAEPLVTDWLPTSATPACQLFIPQRWYSVAVGAVLPPITVDVANETYGSCQVPFDGVVSVHVDTPGIRITGTLSQPLSSSARPIVFADLALTSCLSGASPLLRFSFVSTTASSSPVTTAVEPAVKVALTSNGPVVLQPRDPLKAGHLFRSSGGLLDELILVVLDVCGRVSSAFDGVVVRAKVVNPQIAVLSGTTSMAAHGGTVEFSDLRLVVASTIAAVDMSFVADGSPEVSCVVRLVTRSTAIRLAVVASVLVPTPVLTPAFVVAHRQLLSAAVTVAIEGDGTVETSDSTTTIGFSVGAVTTGSTAVKRSASGVVAFNNFAVESCPPAFDTLRMALVSDGSAEGCASVDLVFETVGLAALRVVIEGAENTQRLNGVVGNELPRLQALVYDSCGRRDTVDGVSVAARIVSGDLVLSGMNSVLTRGGEASFFGVVPLTAGDGIVTFYVNDSQVNLTYNLSLSVATKHQFSRYRFRPFMSSAVRHGGKVPLDASLSLIVVEAMSTAGTVADNVPSTKLWLFMQYSQPERKEKELVSSCIMTNGVCSFDGVFAPHSCSRVRFLVVDSDSPQMLEEDALLTSEFAAVADTAPSPTRYRFCGPSATLNVTLNRFFETKENATLPEICIEAVDACGLPFSGTVITQGYRVSLSVDYSGAVALTSTESDGPFALSGRASLRSVAIMKVRNEYMPSVRLAVAVAEPNRVVLLDSNPILLANQPTLHSVVLSRHCIFTGCASGEVFYNATLQGIVVSPPAQIWTVMSSGELALASALVVEAYDADNLALLGQTAATNGVSSINFLRVPSMFCSRGYYDVLFAAVDSKRNVSSAHLPGRVHYIPAPRAAIVLRPLFIAKGSYTISGTPLPTAVLTVLDSCGDMDTGSHGMYVQMRFSSSANLTVLGPQQAFVGRGRALFTQLTPFGAGVITITFYIGNVSVSAEPLRVYLQPQLQYSMRLQSPSDPTSMVMVAPNGQLYSPISVAMFDSNGMQDNSSSTVTLVASASGGAVITVAEAVHFVGGVAVIQRLNVSRCPFLVNSVVPAVSLTLVAEGGGFPVHGATLTLSRLIVQGWPDFALRFPSDNSSFTESSNVVVTSFISPILVRLEVADSCGMLQKDSNATVTVYGANFTFGGANTSLVRGGIATFLLSLYDPRPSSTFAFVLSSLSNGNLTGTWKVSIRDYYVAFSSSSVLTGQTAYTATIPSLPFSLGTSSYIAIDIYASDGGLQRDNSQAVVVATTSSAQLRGFSMQASDGTVQFRSLQFLTCPREGDIMLFTVQQSGAPINGKTLQSGPLYLHAVSLAAMRFSPSRSLVTSNGQIITGQVGTVLDAVVVEVLNSCGNVDTSVNGLVAVSSLGNTAIVFSGTAVFNDLTVPSLAGTKVVAFSLPNTTLSAVTIAFTLVATTAPATEMPISAGEKALLGLTKPVSGCLTVTLGFSATYMAAIFSNSALVGNFTAALRNDLARLTGVALARG